MGIRPKEMEQEMFKTQADFDMTGGHVVPINVRSAILGPDNTATSHCVLVGDEAIG